MIRSDASPPVSDRVNANYLSPQNVGPPNKLLTVSGKIGVPIDRGAGSFKSSVTGDNAGAIITVLMPAARSWQGFFSTTLMAKVSPAEHYEGPVILKLITLRVTSSL